MGRRMLQLALALPFAQDSSVDRDFDLMLADFTYHTNYEVSQQPTCAYLFCLGVSFTSDVFCV